MILQFLYENLDIILCFILIKKFIIYGLLLLIRNRLSCIKKEVNSIAILDLFHIIPINFQLYKLNSFNQVLIFINRIINKIYDCLAIYKDFNNIITNFHAVFLFFLM